MTPDHPGSRALGRNGGRPPRDITVVRVLLLLTGAATAVNGLLELNPTYRASTHWLGWLLIALGAACWLTVLRLRSPRRGVRELPVLLVVLALTRIYQAVEFSSAAAALGLVLPALVLWRLRRPAARDWLRPDGPVTAPARRALALFGAVGLTASALVTLAAAGTATAAWPCSFPQPTSGALDTTTAGAASAAPTGHVDASDGVRLAYYAYLPAHPVASLVFYHGSGANSAAGYLPLGDLAAKYRIATYLVDIRGHGASGGPRGDAPTPEQVWDDVGTVADFVHQRQPGVPEFLGGHSAGAGLVLNSLAHVHTPIAGYAFLAPDFGLHSDTELVGGASNFATVCTRPFVVNALSNHVLDGHAPALGFAYSQAQVRSAHLVARYTVNMALAQNPDGSSTDLRGIRAPLAVWIGAEDEVFSPDKVLAYARQNRPPGAATTLETVPGASHLGILDQAVDRLGPWITAAARS